MNKMAKVKFWGDEPDGTKHYVIQCPGCGNQHRYSVGGVPGARPRWTFNESLDAPTFAPSLVTWHDGEPRYRCHFFVNNGAIQFLSDCTHALAGQTVALPEVE